MGEKKTDEVEDDAGNAELKALAPLYYAGLVFAIVIPGILLLLMNLFPPVENIFCDFAVVC